MLDKLLNFDGRATRSEFWNIHVPTVALQVAALCYFGVTWLAAAHDGQIEMADFNVKNLTTVFADHRSQILPILFFPMLLQVAVAMRRMNDRGRPTWWVAFLVSPIIALLLLGQPSQNLVNPSYLSATAFVLLGWYFIELGFLPGTFGALQRANKSAEWLDSLAASVAETKGQSSAPPRSAGDVPSYAAAEAAIDRAIAERRMSDRRDGDRRVGMPDTRDVKVERRNGDRRGSAADRRGDSAQGFGRRG